jgi:transposase-like protein
VCRRFKSAPAHSDPQAAYADTPQYDPVAVAHSTESLSDSVAFYDLPMNWWKRVRTNNPQERLIRTLRLRPMGCFCDEPAIERAVFGQLLRRHKVKHTQYLTPSGRERL